MPPRDGLWKYVAQPKMPVVKGHLLGGSIYVQHRQQAGAQTGDWDARRRHGEWPLMGRCFKTDQNNGWKVSECTKSQLTAHDILTHCEWVHFTVCDTVSQFKCKKQMQAPLQSEVLPKGGLGRLLFWILDLLAKPRPHGFFSNHG